MPTRDGEIRTFPSRGKIGEPKRGNGIQSFRSKKGGRKTINVWAANGSEGSISTKEVKTEGSINVEEERSEGLSIGERKPKRKKKRSAMDPRWN